jgi:hypothetical protein
MLAVLIAALGMALVESVRSTAPADDDDRIGLFVGSAHALAEEPSVRASRH